MPTATIEIRLNMYTFFNNILVWLVNSTESYSFRAVPTGRIILRKKKHVFI